MNNLSKARILVLIGGSGSNLQALIDNQNVPEPPYQIVGVISHRPDVYGLIRAQQAHLPTTVIDHRQYPTKAEFESALLEQVFLYQPDLIALAGFMRVLSPFFVNHFVGKMLNIHPALLPKFKGLHTHQRALAAGETEHGATIHFVTAELDGGPIIAQVKVPILSRDTEETLSQRVLQAEHWLYPQVVTWYAQNRLKCEQNIVTVDNKVVGPQGLLLTLPSGKE